MYFSEGDLKGKGTKCCVKNVFIECRYWTMDKTASKLKRMIKHVPLPSFPPPFKVLSTEEMKGKLCQTTIHDIRLD